MRTLAAVAVVLLCAAGLEARASAALWNTHCDTCHGASPSGARANAAGASGVISAAITNVASMNGLSGLSGANRTSLADYIETIINTTPMAVSTGYNVTKVQSLSGKVSLNTAATSLTTLVAVASPSKGSVSFSAASNNFTYNPDTCAYGADSFTYRARNAGSTLFTSIRTVNITIGNPPIPDITSSANKSGQVGVPLTYSIVAANCPASYSAISLPAGLSVSSVSGSVSGTPDVAAVTNNTLRAHNVSGIGTQLTTFTISKGPQAISFPSQTTSSRPFSTSTFSISPLAALTPQAPASVISGLAITYTSGSPGVCSVSGTTVTMLTSGPCILEANQGGNGNWLAAGEQTRTVTITGTVPGVPTGLAGTPGDTQASIAFNAPTNNGGSQITLYTATCTAAGQTTRVGNNGGSPVVVGSLVNGVTYACTVRATNATGQGAASSAVNVLPTATPVPPAITSANNTAFMRGSFGTFTVTRTGTPTPTLSMTGTLPSGVSFVPATGVLSGTPALGSNASYPVTFTATNTSGTAPQNFTLGVSKLAQAITFAQPTSPRPFSPTPFAVSASANSGLTVTIESLTPGTCSYAAGNVTLLVADTCTLRATQAGNTDYAAATPVNRSIVVEAASQTITFGLQVPATRPYAPSGSFGVDPLATASSGLAISYSSLTASVCTVKGDTVSIAGVGTCTIAADQGGDSNYTAAPQVTQPVEITATVPDAPTIGAATPGSAQASIEFAPPANDGGSQITGFMATCNPGALTGTAEMSPIVVSGLTNGVEYSCRITASNAAGTSLPSSAALVTPVGATGAQIWQTTCSGCHGVEPPSGTRFNAAGTTSTVLQYVRATQPEMLADAGVQALTTLDLEAIAAYIQEQVPPVVATTLPNTAKTVSLAGTIFVNTVSFQNIQVVTPPANGTLAPFAGLNATYTPNPGFTGTDTFTYRGRRLTPVGVLGDVRTATIHVSADAPVLTAVAQGKGFVFTTGIFCPGDCSETYNVGAPVTLTAFPDAGARFSAWVGCDSVNEADECELTMSNSREVTAIFAALRGPDFDANGTGDLLWQHSDGRAAIWLMLGTSPASTAEIIGAATGWSVAHLADFDGDGRADLLWQHTDGSVAIYLMDGAVPFATQQVLNAASGWSAVHTPDLDGDGRADIVWQNTDGSVAVWTMNGTSMISGAGIMAAASGWAVIATGDFNGDARGDLVWRHADGRHAIWLMDGTAILATNQILNAGDWTAIHARDLDGDGKADLVWQHADGTIALWLMDGAAMSSGAGLLNAGTGWSVPRVGDLNGDGKADLFFLHADGRAAVYLMDGLAPIATQQILNAGGGWSAKRIQDLDGDGKDDIVWENVDGSVAVWLMDGTAMTSGSQLVGTGTGWSVSGVSP